MLRYRFFGYFLLTVALLPFRPLAAATLISGNTVAATTLRIGGELVQDRVDQTNTFNTVFDGLHLNGLAGAQTLDRELSGSASFSANFATGTFSASSFLERDSQLGNGYGSSAALVDSRYSFNIIGDGFVTVSLDLVASVASGGSVRSTDNPYATALLGINPSSGRPFQPSLMFDTRGMAAEQTFGDVIEQSFSETLSLTFPIIDGDTFTLRAYLTSHGSIGNTTAAYRSANIQGILSVESSGGASVIEQDNRVLSAPPAPVPLPAGGVLILSGLACFGLFTRFIQRRKLVN